jgi:hypothetical protein
MAEIPTDKLEDDLFGLQNGTRSGAVGEPLNTFVYGLLFVLRGNSIVAESVR